MEKSVCALFEPFLMESKNRRQRGERAVQLLHWGRGHQLSTYRTSLLNLILSYRLQLT